MMQTSAHGSTHRSERESRGCGRHERVASRSLVVSLALLACQATEHPPDARPPAIAAPSPPREEHPPHDDFHALLATPASGQAMAEVPAELLKAAVKRSNAASFEVWRALEPRDNLVVSPYSIRSALGLVYLASLPGRARSSLQSRLHYPARNEDMDVRLLHAVARAAEDTGFGSASALWVDRQHVLSPAYLDAASRSLPAEVHSIDFAADPGRADRMINAWGSERTRGLIPSIFDEGSSHELLRSVLVDTVYLAWDRPSSPGITPGKFSRSFSTARGMTVKADMELCSPCIAVVRPDYQAAFANYHGRGESLMFVAVMPKRWSDFRWNAAAFRRVWASLAHSRVAELELPRLHLRSRQDLAAVMTKLDLDPADLQLQQGLLASGEPVALGALVHETSIQIDETTVLFEPLPSFRKLLGERISVRIDRPFYFMFIEPKTGLVLLMGQVTDPTA
jgi:serine protease inhibitor